MIDPVEFGKQMAAIVREATAPLVERIAELEKALSDAPAPAAPEIDVGAIAKAAAELIPAPKDGKSVTADDVRPILAEMVDSAVNAIPVPKDGKDGKDGTDGKDADMAELKLHLRSEERRVGKECRYTRWPRDWSSDVCSSDLGAIAKAAAELIPAPKDGKSVTADDVRPILAEMVDSAVNAIPVPKDGKDGKDGTDGKDADMAELKLHLAELVKHVNLPTSPSVDEVAAVFERRFSDLTLSWERQARDTFERAVDRMPVPKDGRDALPLESFDLTLSEDGRTLTVKMQAADGVVEKSIRVASIIDRGIYKAACDYEKGDAVTHGGSLWIAQQDAPEGAPGMGGKGWRLAVKKGRDGKDLRDNSSTADTTKGVSVK